MTLPRVLAIGLDGYEPSIGEDMMAAGSLPALARLRDQSARFLLDHGPAQRIGLAWEHVSSGLSPERAQRFAAVAFDPSSYAVWQEGTTLSPFVRDLPARTVVFDAPYFDLTRAPGARGLVNWGAHDPGVATGARPQELLAEFIARFGAYPATGYIYGSPWRSAEQTRDMGRWLCEAVEVRSRAARWLLAERLPDWDLALVVVSEPHSAIEGLCHGIDPKHPLHHLPSAQPAAEGLAGVYRATDRLVGELVEAFPDARVVAFSMGGMGRNLSDVASMVLLPELLYRNFFGRPLLRPRADWSHAPGGLPLLGEDEEWHAAMHERLPFSVPPRERLRRTIGPWLPASIKRGLRSFLPPSWSRADDAPAPADGPLRLSLDWMPAARYQPYWHAMPAFALPSFYDGRIRINLAGRERAGKVEPSRYAALCDELETLLRECRDPTTGAGIIDFIERPAGARDPRTLGPSESDMVVVWNGPLGLDHPRFGRIGPIPYRRTGGHTGSYGMAYVHAPGVAPGDRGVRSSFDVVPTLIDLLGVPVPTGVSGETLSKR